MRAPVLPLLFIIGANQASATPPPPPPPPADSLAIAAGFWPDAARLRAQLNAYASYAVGQTTTEMLAKAKVKLGTSKWREKKALLYGYFWDNIQPQLEGKLQTYLECNARPFAYMSVAELEHVDAFLKTGAGRTFWNRANLEERYMGHCAREVLRGDLSKLKPEGWKIIGVKQPPPDFFPPA